MKKIIFTFIISASMISFNASAQTIRENIDKLAKDKATQEERAAKADVYIMKNKITDDSTNVKATDKKVVAKTSAGSKTKYKSKKAGKKCNSSK